MSKIDTIKRLLSKLDLSEAERLKRAKEMGFDTSKTYYHGTKGKDFEKFNTPDVFVSESPKFAHNYAKLFNDYSGSRIIPVKIKTNNIFDINNPSHEKKLENSLVSYFKENPPTEFERNVSGHFPLEKISPENRAILHIKGLKRDETTNWMPMEMGPAKDLIKNMGFEGMKIKEDGVNNINIFDPKNIRSKFAKFDPSKADSSNISSFTKNTTDDGVINPLKLIDRLTGNPLRAGTSAVLSGENPFPAAWKSFTKEEETSGEEIANKFLPMVENAPGAGLPLRAPGQEEYPSSKPLGMMLEGAIDPLNIPTGGLSRFSNLRHLLGK